MIEATHQIVYVETQVPFFGRGFDQGPSSKLVSWMPHSSDWCPHFLGLARPQSGPIPENVSCVTHPDQLAVNDMR